MNKLWRKLRELGFAINYSKIVGPTKRITFLGVEIDTETLTLGLPEEKCAALSSQLWEVFNKQSITKRKYWHWSQQRTPGAASGKTEQLWSIRTMYQQ